MSSILGIISIKNKKFIRGHTCFKTAKAREIWQQRKIWVGGASAVASVVVSSFPVSHTLVPCRHYNCECVYVPHFIICYAQAHGITPLSSLSTVGLLDMKTFQTFFFKSDFKKYLIWPPFTEFVLSWIKQEKNQSNTTVEVIPSNWFYISGKVFKNLTQSLAKKTEKLVCKKTLFLKRSTSCSENGKRVVVCCCKAAAKKRMPSLKGLMFHHILQIYYEQL